MGSSEVVWWDFREKNIQGTRASCWSWKVQRSFKFVFHISSLSSRSKMLVFVWLIHGAARWPHMVGRPLFYESALPAVPLRGSDFLFTLPVLCCLLSAAWGEKENFDLRFPGDAANFGWPNYRINSVLSLHEIIQNLKKKMFPRKSLGGGSRNPGFETPWSDAQPSIPTSLSPWKSPSYFLACKLDALSVCEIWKDCWGGGKVRKGLQSREEELKKVWEQGLLW